MKAARLSLEHYRILFDRNVAGIILTNVQGQIIDCNEACARILGFASRSEVVEHNASDFYFNPAEREIFIDRLRVRGHCPAEELCLRGKNGMPVWVLANSSVTSYAHGRPELLQGTFIDITAQRKKDARLRDAKPCGSVRITKSENSSTGPRDGLGQRLATQLNCLSKTLQANNLPRVDRAKVQECALALEQIKMLLAELEICYLPSE